LTFIWIFMLEAIVYSDIEQKNILEKQGFVALSPHESLIHSLDVMDFFAALRGKPMLGEELGERIEWIELNYKK
jgi:hypothetical protein